MEAPPTQRDALEVARGLLEATFGDGGPQAAAPLLAVHAPARSEIAGNHTDHEGGHVIAGTLDVSVDGVARANGRGVVRVASVGYPTLEVSLDDLSPREEERVSTQALVRGMAAQLAATGREPAGFDLALTSTIPAGGGLFRSAAVEAAVSRAMAELWDGAPVGAVQLAQMCQRAENDWFGKPCGLMDQASVCLGGLAFMDFEDAARPRTERLDFDFDGAGVALCLVDVGCDHAPFTADYAAVPTEMQLVARRLGHERLCEVDQAEFDRLLPKLREELGDRAVLRAIHYWYENDLVDRRWAALKASDLAGFLELTRDSGASSAMYLQNVSTGGSFQPAMLALGLAERLLEGAGAIRIHGGGFGGSIQCFVPTGLVGEFAERMDAWLGAGACRHYQISQRGACATWL